MTFSLDALTPHRTLYHLRLTESVELPFFHGGVLRGLISRAVGEHELPAGVVPVVCEAGRVRFEAGMEYRLGLSVVGEGQEWGRRLEEGLGRTGAVRGKGGRLAGNFRVEEVQALPGREGKEQVRELAKALGAAGELRLTFVAPLRLQRPAALRRKGEGFFDEHCFPIDHFFDRLARRLFLLQHGRYPNEAERSSFPSVGADAAADPRDLFWLDVPVPGRQGKARTLGGVVGTVRLRGVSEAWLPYLVAGQGAHTGSSVAFGLGRYVLSAAGQVEEALAADPFRPARSLLAEVADPLRLADALDHVLQLSAAAGVDGETPGQLAPRRAPVLRSLAAELAGGTYRPAPLRGVLLREDDGGLRPLAIPTVRDRAAQRAAAQVLGEAVDTLLEEASYAYRRGYSRRGAAAAIERAYGEGYRYVLDADIRAFFDSVQWPRLFRRLRALYPFEPLRPLVEAWVRAPVELELPAPPGEPPTIRRLSRHRGLPQGSSVSPLLANLYLDSFDDDLLGADFRLVRYADDFVVLCRDLERAREARRVAQRALRELGLELHDEKTAVRSIDEGFTYLGYLFCRSLVLERRPDAPDDAPVRPLTADDIPAASWLAEVPFQQIRQLVHGEARGRRGTTVEIVPLAPAASASGSSAPGRTPLVRRPVYVTSPEARLRLDDGALHIQPPPRSAAEGSSKAGDGQSAEISLPLATLSHVVFVGRPATTVPLLLALAEADVPVYFCRPDGELFATLGPHEAEWHLWQEQGRHAANTDARLAFARAVVAAQLVNRAVLAVRFRWQGARELAKELRELSRRCDNPTTVDALRGLEGRGAALYFAALGESLPEGWSFAGRQRQPPPDPVNALLSFGYTLLHHHIATALTVQGLDPRVGLYHQGRGTHQALASDLQEELRFLVEALVWSLLRRRRLRPEDFAPSPDGRYPCLLRRDARKTFVDAFEGRLLTAFTPPGADAPVTYREFIAHQALALRRLVTGEAPRYEPLRITA